MAKVSSIGSNMTEIQKDDGNRVLVSYSTPVAAYLIGVGYVKSSKDYSRTTSGHITKWAGKKVTQTMPQDFFDGLI